MGVLLLPPQLSSVPPVGDRAASSLSDGPRRAMLTLQELVGDEFKGLYAVQGITEHELVQVRTGHITVSYRAHR